MDISVVVPVYNASPFLTDCLQALQSQTYPPDSYEILMVDNNSTDDSAAIIESTDSIRLLRERKQGAYAARNRGVQESTGSILAFTDPDCVVSPDWLSQIAERLSDPRVGIVLGRTRSKDESTCLSLMDAYAHAKNDFIYRSQCKELYYGYANNMAVRRSVLKKSLPFVEQKRGADTILVRQTVEAHTCEIVKYAPEVRVLHLEVDNVGKLYRKIFIYGRSRQLYKHIATVRPLSLSERLLVYRRAIQLHQFSTAKAVVLLGLIAGGLACWTIGSLCGALTPKN